MKNNAKGLPMVKLLAVLSVAVLVAACSTTPVGGAGGVPSSVTPAEALGASALPPGASIKADQSLIIGTGENWVGRAVVDAGKDLDAAWRFFLETYPQQGWTVVAAVRSKTSLLVFTKQDRTATVEINEGGVLGSASVVLTVTPRNAAVAAPRKS